MIFKARLMPYQRYLDQKTQRILSVTKMVSLLSTLNNIPTIKIANIFQNQNLILDALLPHDPPSVAFPSETQKDQKRHAPKSPLKELFTSPGSFKPFLLLLGLFVLMQSTGTFAIIFYAVNVFQGI